MNEKMMIRSADSVFLNSKSVFVEYIDVIKSPYFLFLYAIMSSDKTVLKEPFDMEIIKNIKDTEELVKWYYCRKNQNPLFDLISDESMATVKFDNVDDFMNKQLEENEVLIKGSSPLNFASVIQKLMTDSILVQKVYIWYPYDNRNIRNDIQTLFQNKDIEFVYGPIDKCLKNIPNDSTYVFSDITNILVLEELEKLDMASILLPVDFAYNLDENDQSLIDLDGLQKDHVFKVNRFLSTTS